MEDDPIVEEVRKYRRQIELECGNDLHKIFERANRLQKLTVKEQIEELERMKDEELVAA